MSTSKVHRNLPAAENRCLGTPFVHYSEVQTAD